MLIGLLDADPASYRTVFPRWQPTLGEHEGRFEIVQLGPPRIVEPRTSAGDGVDVSG